MKCVAGFAASLTALQVTVLVLKEERDHVITCTVVIYLSAISFLTAVHKLSWCTHKLSFSRPTLYPIILMMPLTPAMARRLSPVSESNVHAHV